MSVERAFIDPAGLPNRPLVRWGASELESVGLVRLVYTTILYDISDPVVVIIYIHDIRQNTTCQNWCLQLTQPL